MLTPLRLPPSSPQCGFWVPCDGTLSCPVLRGTKEHPDCGRSHWCGLGRGHGRITDFLEEVGFELGLEEGFGESRKEERGCDRHVTVWGGRVAVCLVLCPCFWGKDLESPGDLQEDL